jgi:hypothetical protein
VPPSGHTGRMTRSMLWVLSEIVLPALRRVLPDDPITRVHLTHCPSPYDGPDGTPDAVQLEVEVAGEVFVDVAYDPMAAMSTEDDARERLISNLADFVAESRFGWGQKRD